MKKEIDTRRELIVLPSKEEAVRFSVDHFIEAASRAINQKGLFNVALSGGSTPKAIFHQFAQPEYRNKVDWAKVQLFWSDERCVPPTDSDSNYRMAMDAGFSNLPLLGEHIHRMEGEIDPEKAADKYEALLKKHTHDGELDYVMLGMGDDGHTASLFPDTEGMKVTDRLAIANYVPEKKAWRLSLTFPCINRAGQIVVYVLGKSKAEIAARVLQKNETEPFPAQKIGTEENRSQWVLDQEAASLVAD